MKKVPAFLHSAIKKTSAGDGRHHICYCSQYTKNVALCTVPRFAMHSSALLGTKCNKLHFGAG